MTTDVTRNQALQHLWQVLDRGELWQEGAAAEQTQAALADVEARLESSTVQASNYLRFLSRSSAVASTAIMAKAG